MSDTSQLLIKLPTSFRAEFKDYAQRHGLTVSDLLRRMMKEEMRSQRTIMTIKPPRTESRYGIATVLCDTEGREYHVQVISHDTLPHLLVLDPENDFWPIAPAELAQSCPIFARIHDVTTEEFWWDTPAFRSLCAELGIDPDLGRPAYKPADENIVAQLRSDLRSTRGDRRLNALIRGLLMLLRIDHFPEIRTFEDCQGILQNWTSKRPPGLYRDAFARVDADRIASSTPVAVAIELLPSWKGGGGGTLIDLWRGGHESDGWSGTHYRHLAGVALRPAHLDLATSVVVDRLTDQGVVFLGLEAARSYMDGEGCYWAFRSQHCVCPEGLPPRRPTLAEHMLWRFQSPDTPLCDRASAETAA